MPDGSSSLERTPVLQTGETSHQTPVPVYVTGGGGGGAGGPATIADGADSTEGAIADAAVSTDTTGTISGKLRGLVKLLASVISAGRLVVDPSGVTSPVSGTVTANLGTIGAAATSAKQDTGNTSVASIDGKVPALGQALAAASTPVVLTAAQITALTPPAAITGFALEAGNLATIVTNIGAVTASPAANTLMDRVKSLLTGIVLAAGSAVIGAVTQSGTWNVGHGKTCKSITGSASATFTAVAAVTSKRIKVIAIELLTASTTAVTVTFKDGAAGTALRTYPLQAITGTNFGLAPSVDAPTFLFATSAGTLLEMSFSAAQTVTYNLTYFDDDAT